ncbi:MAG: Fur family transcriptional regulator [Thermoplasmatota archaeon]
MELPRSQQGRAVLEAVQQLDHPTADQVFAQVRKSFPKISLGTVYRNLDALVAKGHAEKREIGGTKRFDPNTAPHIHLHDVSTNRLIDLPLTPVLEAELRTLCEQHFEGEAECILELKGNLKP